MLRVAALQLGDPFPLRILPEPDDAPLGHPELAHPVWVRTASLPRVSFEKYRNPIKNH